MLAVSLFLIGCAPASSRERIRPRIQHMRNSADQEQHVRDSSFETQSEDFAMMLLALGNLGIGQRFRPSREGRIGDIWNTKQWGSLVEPYSSRSAIPRAAVVDKSNLVKVTDELHEKNDVNAYFDMLVTADESDSDIAWRMARAYHDKAMETDDEKEREGLIRKGVAIAENACESSGDGYALKWYGILLGRLGDHLSTKEKVANSFKIKEALEGSATKLPQDATVKTALGQWCYKVAGISFIERNAAKLLFGTPPESSFEEALEHLLASYKVRPSKKAALYAGLCYQKLKQKDEAKKWFQACLDLPSFGKDDAELDKQANAGI